MRSQEETHIEKYVLVSLLGLDAISKRPFPIVLDTYQAVIRY